MSRVSPFDTAPELVERRKGLVDMMVRDQPNVSALQFYGAPSINDAYGNPTGSGVGGSGAEPMFVVERGLQFRSPSLIKRRWGWYGEVVKNVSRVAWNPSEYASDPATSFPGDDDTWFVRVQESRPAAGGFLEINGPVDTGDPKLGSIYVVPPAIWFGQPTPSLTLQGTAPAGTGAVAGGVPQVDPDMQVPNPMHIVFPRWTTSCFVMNLGAPDLYVSTGWGVPMSTVQHSSGSPLEFGGGVKELVLAGADATDFYITAIVALGPGG